jgi:hypothetical protein
VPTTCAIPSQVFLGHGHWTSFFWLLGQLVIQVKAGAFDDDVSACAVSQSSWGPSEQCSKPLFIDDYRGLYYCTIH